MPMGALRPGARRRWGAVPPGRMLGMWGRPRAMGVGWWPGAHVRWRCRAHVVPAARLPMVALAAPDPAALAPGIAWPWWARAALSAWRRWMAIAVGVMAFVAIVAIMAFVVFVAIVVTIAPFHRHDHTARQQRCAGQYSAHAGGKNSRQALHGKTPWVSGWARLRSAVWRVARQSPITKQPGHMLTGLGIVVLKRK